MFSKLTQLFLKFPGIGPRQAKRFVYFLLSESPAFVKAFTEEIEHTKKETDVCDSCFRFFKKTHGDKSCGICEDSSRDRSALLVVGSDIDFENIEKTGHFKGLYFILGDTLPILEKEPEKKIRVKELKTLIEKRTKEGLKEIVLALNATPDGEYTSIFIKEALSPVIKKYSITLSNLGRGLSTGTELEYSDPETIKSALQNRI